MKTANELAEAIKAATAKRGGLSNFAKFAGRLGTATPAELEASGWTIPEIRAAAAQEPERFVFIAARQTRLVKTANGYAYGRSLGEIQLKAQEN